MNAARVRQSFIVGASFAVAASFLAACGSDTTAPKRDNVPASITSTTTGTLTAPAGATVNTLLSVVVKNAAGQGADSALVTFTVTSGGGSVSNTTVRTDTTGIASTTWTLGGTAGTQTVTASVGTLAPVTFTATATAGAASGISKVAGDAQTASAGAAVATPPSVKVVDKFGNPVSGVLVTFTPSTGGAVTGGSVATNASGVATVGSWRLSNTAGANTLTAAAAGVTSSLTFTATGTIGTASRIAITSAAIPNLNVGQQATITAQAFDANNNQIPSPTFSFTSSNTAVATVSAGGVVTAVGAGNATITVAIGTATATVNVTVIGHPGVTNSSTLNFPARLRNVVAAGSNAFVAGGITGAVYAVNSQGAIVWADTIGGTVVDVAVDAAANTVVAATTGGAGTPMLYLIRAGTGATLDSVALGANPQRITMNSAGTRAFVDETNFQLATIDIASRTVISSTPLGGTVNAMKMAPGDSLFYVGTAFGTVYEMRASNTTVKRQFSSTSTVVDLAISPDGATLAIADGTPTVTLVALSSTGSSGTLGFGTAPANNVNGVAFTPDGNQLWASAGNTIVAAPSDGAGGFITGLVQNRTTVAGTSLSKIAFGPNGTTAFVIDDAGFKLVLFQ